MTTRFVILGTLAAGSLLATACGGGDDTNTGGTGASASSTGSTMASTSTETGSGGATTTSDTTSSSGASSTTGSGGGDANGWKPLRIGAGGFLTGIDIAPDGTRVVRTDTYGAYLWNGTEWKQLVSATSMPAAKVAPGNNGGVYEIKIAPSMTSRFYMMYLGLVFRSDDKGGTWTQTSFTAADANANDNYRTNGQKMAVDPQNPDVVYAGTSSNGFFVTTDGGASWQSVGAVPVSQAVSDGNPGITGVLFDPTSGVTSGKTRTIYASSYGNGVFRSTDAGVTWSAIAGGPSDVESGAMAIDGAYYVTGDGEAGVFKYASGAWSEVLSGNSFHSVVADPFDAAHVLVVIDSGNVEDSLDHGATWGGLDWTNQLTSNDIPWLTFDPGVTSYMAVGGVAFDPTTQNSVWASAGVGVWTTSVTPGFSPSAPLAWTSHSLGIEQLVANEVIAPPGGKPIVASWDRAFFRVDDPDAFPTSYGVNNTHSIVAGWSVDYASTTPSFLVGLADWWGVEESAYSTDGGQSWTIFPNMPPFVGQTIGGTVAASSPTNLVWAPADKQAPYYTKDGGSTWSPIALPGVSDWNDLDWAYYLDKRSVAADRVTEGTFYLYDDGVFRTTDGGDTWTNVHAGEVTPNSTYNSRLKSVPGNAGHLFFTAGPLSGNPQPISNATFMHSTDGGVTWTAVPNVLEAFDFGFGKAKTDGGYPAIYIVGWVNGQYGVWQSDDEGQTWTSLGEWPLGSIDSIKAISGDLDTYGRVYIGFSGSGYAYR